MRSSYLLTTFLLFILYASLNAQTPQASASAKEAEMLQTAPTDSPTQSAGIPALPAKTEPVSALPEAMSASEPHAAMLSADGLSEQSASKPFRKKAGGKATNDPERKTHWANIFSGVSAGVIIACLLGLGQGGFFVFTSFFLTVPAIVIGIIGITKSGKDKPFKGKGWGIFGVVTGAVVLLFYVLLFIALAALFS